MVADRTCPDHGRQATERKDALGAAGSGLRRCRTDRLFDPERDHAGAAAPKPQDRRVPLHRVGTLRAARSTLDWVTKHFSETDVPCRSQTTKHNQSFRSATMDSPALWCARCHTAETLPQVRPTAERCAHSPWNMRGQQCPHIGSISCRRPTKSTTIALSSATATATRLSPPRNYGLSIHGSKSGAARGWSTDGGRHHPRPSRTWGRNNSLVQALVDSTTLVAIYWFCSPPRFETVSCQTGVLIKGDEGAAQVINLGHGAHPSGSASGDDATLPPVAP